MGHSLPKQLPWILPCCSISPQCWLQKFCPGEGLSKHQCGGQAKQVGRSVLCLHVCVYVVYLYCQLVYMHTVHMHGYICVSVDMCVFKCVRVGDRL